METFELTLQEKLLASKIFNIYKRIPKKAQNILTGYARGRNGLEGIGNISKPLTSKQLQNIHFIRTEKDISDGVEISIKAESPELSKIQNGINTKEYDMKQTYPYGKKSRIIKTGKNKGQPYLIIPFRWGTPNQKDTKRANFASYIPQLNYFTNVKKLKITRRLETTHTEANFSGEQIERSEYGYGKNGKMKRGFADALKDSDAFGEISEFSGLHYSAGMVRMKSNTGTNYFTFRIITPFQRKDMWIRKGKTIPGINIESAWGKTIQKSIMNAMMTTED